MIENVQDDRTAGRGYLKPHPANRLNRDALRLRDSFDLIDADVVDLFSHLAAMPGSTDAKIAAAIGALTAGAPDLLNTFAEVAAKLASDDAQLSSILSGLGSRVRVDAAQVLTAIQRSQARVNIGAGRFENDAYQNLLINPRFRVQQFAPPASLISSSAYVCDGWYAATFGLSGAAGIVTRTGSPSVVFTTRPELNFGLSMSCVTAKANLSSTDFANIVQPIQGYRTEDLRWGTAQAKPMVIAFPYRGNISGNLPACLRNGGSNRTLLHDVPFTPGTEGFAVIPVIPDTQGTWAGGSGVGMRLSFNLAAGSQYVGGAADTWLAGNFLATSASTNFFAKAGNQVVIGDVLMLPVDDVSDTTIGSISADRLQMFRRQYEDELRICRRFFRKSYNQGDMPGAITTAGAMAFSMIGFAPSGNIQAAAPLPLEEVMAGPPALTIYSPATGASGKGRDLSANADCSAFYGTLGDSGASLVFATQTAGSFNVQGHYTLDARPV